jgi:DNA modification methylase
MIANADSIRIPLADGVVQCVVTSPPYWGLRAYSGEQERVWPDGWRGGLGLEPTPEMFIEHLVQVFREVRRVMRDDGVAWVNMGDCYAGSGKGAWGTNEARENNRHRIKETYIPTRQESPLAGITPKGFKPKDLVMMPHRLALALQADGWWVRSDVVWAKPNPMPESLSGWRWEQCKVKVKAGHLPARNTNTITHEGGKAWNNGKKPEQSIALGLTAQWQDCTGCPKCEATDGLVLRRGSWRPTNSHEYVFMLAKSSTYFSDGEAVREGRSLNGDNLAGRNLRSVWNIATQPYKGAHYATFPTALAQRCVLASTSRHACAECGASWARVVEQKSYRPSCQCGADVRPCIVLDPFCGSGTVGQVCRELPHQRDFVGLDLSFDYLRDQALIRSEQLTPASKLAELPMFT